MKTKFYFGALAALALGLTGCSSEEPTPDQGGAPTGGERYMAVTIRSLSDTRAVPGDDDFEVGTDKENKLTTDDIRFYFFTDKGAPFLMQQVNVNGTVSNTNMVAPLELSQTTTNGSPTQIQGVLVLGKPASEADPSVPYQGETPARVIAIANPKVTSFDAFANKSISAVQELHATLDNLEFEKFSMTSSTYLEKGEAICYTDVTGNICTTEKAAKEKPAQIYLERLAAKVRVTGLGEYTVKDKDLKDAVYPVRKQDGEAVNMKLKVNLMGWRLINRAVSTYALKDISGLTEEGDGAPFDDWNDSARHRCYWANTFASDKNQFENTTYSLSDAEAFTLGNFDSKQPEKNIAYTYGNTRFVPVNGASDRASLATGIVVKAQVTDEAGNPVDLIKWGAEYFTLDYFRKVVANAWNKSSGVIPIPADVLADPEKLAAAITFEKETGVVDNVNVKINTWRVLVNGNAFDVFKGIYWWNNGITTYRTNILHNSATNLFGVVRNHIYDYKFTNVVGLGLPGEDPVNPPDVKESYLAAVVNVLNWHIISNETVLE